MEAPVTFFDPHNNSRGIAAEYSNVVWHDYKMSPEAPVENGWHFSFEWAILLNYNKVSIPWLILSVMMKFE